MELIVLVLSLEMYASPLSLLLVRLLRLSFYCFTIFRFLAF